MIDLISGYHASTEVGRWWGNSELFMVIWAQTRISHTALITGKGEIWLRKKLLETGHLKAVAA